PGMDDEAVADAVSDLMRSVQNQFNNVLVPWLRELDEDPDAARQYFSRALDAYPDEAPSEAVYRLYDDLGQTLPRYSTIERDRMRRQLAAAERDGDQAKALELAKAL